MDKYIIHLKGIKDQEFYICDKKHWDWINDGIVPDDFNFAGIGEAEGWDPDKAEEYQREEMARYDDNDRALYLSWCKDAILCFGVFEYTKFIIDNHVNILGTYEGALY